PASGAIDRTVQASGARVQRLCGVRVHHQGCDELAAVATRTGWLVRGARDTRARRGEGAMWAGERFTNAEVLSSGIESAGHLGINSGIAPIASYRTVPT